MAAAFELLDDNEPPSEVADFIQELARLVEELSAEDVLRDINEDREISRFAEVKSVEEVEEELVERKRYFRDVIKSSQFRHTHSDFVTVLFRVKGSNRNSAWWFCSSIRHRTSASELLGEEATGLRRRWPVEFSFNGRQAASSRAGRHEKPPAQSVGLRL